jgi:hypothetical protein
MAFRWQVAGKRYSPMCWQVEATATRAGQIDAEDYTVAEVREGRVGWDEEGTGGQIGAGGPRGAAVREGRVARDGQGAAGGRDGRGGGGGRTVHDAV